MDKNNHQNSYKRFIQIFRKSAQLLLFCQGIFNRNFLKFFEKINLMTPSSCMALKQGPNWGYWAQNAVKVVKFIKIACFQWS
jgi:hypothetical protein